MRREDSFSVYQRAGEPCRLGAAPVLTRTMVARDLFWCPRHQAS